MASVRARLAVREPWDSAGLSRPQLLIVSRPAPASIAISGSRQRLSSILTAARGQFDVTLAAIASASDAPQLSEQMAPLCDRLILLDPERHSLPRLLRRSLESLVAGPASPGFVLGEPDLSPRRSARLLSSTACDCVLVEHWPDLYCGQITGGEIPCVLDVHRPLWRTCEPDRRGSRWIPALPAGRNLRDLRRREEHTWSEFDALIASNRPDLAYFRQTVPRFRRLFYVPRNIELKRWDFCWLPARPARVVFFGGLDARYNAAAALRCARRILPKVWERRPDTELWIVGYAPPPSLLRLARESRIRVTGYLSEIRLHLRTMHCLLCPWTGAYGPRTSLLEAMALGLPVVATPEAAGGLDLAPGAGLLLGRSDEELAARVLDLLDDGAFARLQSVLARRQIERLHSLGNPYIHLAAGLRDLVEERRHTRLELAESA